MSRRTPIKELIAEDAGTPSSPIRRSTRIATRRPSAHEDSASQKIKSQDIDDSDQVSVSSTSSAGSKLGRKTRTSSKSPIPEDVNKIPARRTRKGSTSSLIEEELASNNRVGSPTPGRLTRRSLARSLSVSPTSEVESTARKTSTPQKRVIESTKSGSIKRGRRLSSSDSVAPLESIKELELSPLKENSQSSIENTNEKDLPVKKKKSALLQPIDEQSFTENNDTDKTENKNEDKETESKSNIDDLNKEEENKKTKQNAHSSNEEKELVIVLNGIDNEETRSKSNKGELNKDKDKSFDQSENTTVNSNSERSETRKSSSLKPEDKLKSPSPGKELMVVLNSIDDIDKSHDKSLSPKENISTNLNSSSEGRNNRKSPSPGKELMVVLSSIDDIDKSHDKSLSPNENISTNLNSSSEGRKNRKSPSPGKELMVVLSSIDDIDKSHDKSLSPNKNISTNLNSSSEGRKNRKSLSLIPKDKSKSPSPRKELMVVLSSTDDIDKSHDKSLSLSENTSTNLNLSSERRKNRKSLSLIPEDKSKLLKNELVVVSSSSTEDSDNGHDKITNVNISKHKESVSSEHDKGNATLEEENISLRISEDDERYDKSLVNDSCSNNNSVEKSLGKESADKISESNNSIEINSEKESADHLGNDQVSNSSLEVNVGYIENAKTSFCEPMDVDLTVSEITLASPSSKKDTETTSSDIRVPEKTKQLDSEKLNSSEIEANTESTDCVTPNTNTKSSELNSEMIKSTADLKVSIEKSPVKNLKSQQPHTSPDQSNITDEATNTIIIATSLTPVRRSPRIKDSKTNVLSNESVSEDVLSINTPPDSIKSGNSSRDTDLEVSGSERNDALQNVSNDFSKNAENFAEPTDNNTVNPQNREKKNEESLETEICNANQENKSINNISFNSEPELNATLQKKINELTERLEIDSSSDESVSNYIEDMAEEGEEDTPSEGSNDIIDLGESIGSTEYETDSDDELDDSFIDDDEEVQLLSGEEYDLGQEKSKPKASKKRKRIIETKDSSDEEKNTETESIIKEVKIHLQMEENNEKKDGENKDEEAAENRNEDSDVENMSTQPYCGLTPPSVVSIRDSPTTEEIKNFNNKDDEESITSVLINKEDNLESLEQIKDHNKHSTSENVNSFSKKESPKKITPIPIRVSKPESKEKKPDSCTPNNSILETSASQSSSKQQRKRLSSLTIQETVNIQDISNGSVSDRILKVVEVFCSSVTKSGDSASGNISLNVSLDYISTSPDKPNIHEEHKEVIAVEPSSHTLQVPLDSERAEEKTSSKTGKRKKSKITISSPIKILFTSDDEQQLSEEQGTQKKKTKKSRKKGLDTNTAANEIVKPTTINRKNKKSVNPKVVKESYSQSDSDMSPDLDKELNKKYSIRVEDNYKNSKESRKENIIPASNNQKASKKVINETEDRPSTSKHSSNKKKHNEIALVEEAPKEKRLKKEEAFSKDVWQINYLPHDIKVALSKGKSKRPSITKSSVEIRVPKKKPKLVPSLNSGNQSWNSYDLDTLLRPSSSSEINKDKKANSFNVEKFHNKDFKNRTLFDSKRVKRMETNELLKKKEKLKF